jgi:hypothetical protein
MRGNFQCFECGKPAKHAHHVVPVNQGGRRTVPLCLKCHGKIHHKTMHSGELTKAGLARRKALGFKLGPKEKPINWVLVAKLRDDGHTIRDIAKELGIGKSALYERISKQKVCA